MSVNEDLADLLIEHRLQLLRYEAGLAEDLLKAYRAAFGDITAEMTALKARALKATTDTEIATVQRQLQALQAKQADLRRAIVAVEPLAVGTLEERLTEVAKAEARFMDVRVARTVGLSWSAVPEAAVIEALRTPIAEGVARTALRMDLLAAEAGVQSALARAMAQGASMPKTAAMIGQGTDIVETYRNRLVAIARTEVQRVANSVALASYAANVDVLDGVEWLATLDSRTCALCAPLHGTVYKLDEAGRPLGMDRRPPVHPRCRCFLAPVVKDYQDLGLKTSPDARREYTGQPAGGPTFDQWLRRQPTSTADEILGPTRAAMFRAGTPLKSFSDARRVLTLGELNV